jgi:negative regulator of sigma E activity
MRVSIAALLLGAGITIAIARGAQDPADPLLRAAIAAPSSVSYVAVVQVVRMGSGSAEASVYRIEHRAPDLTRRSYTAPADLAGDSVVTKGDLSFSIDVKRKRVVETRDDADDATAIRADYSLLRENYRVIRKGEEVFDGRQAIDVALISRSTGRTTMFVRVDASNDTVLDRQEFAPNGALVSETRFEAVEYSTPAATDFTFPSRYTLVRDAAFATASQGADGAVKRAGFAAREPRSLPGGFAPVEGQLVEMRGVRTVQLLYSDGLRTVSLFENAQPSTLETASLRPQPMRVGGRSAEYVEDGATALLTWNDGTLYYTLVADVGLVDLRSLAASIAP